MKDAPSLLRKQRKFGLRDGNIKSRAAMVIPTLASVTMLQQKVEH